MPREEAAERLSHTSLRQSYLISNGSRSCRLCRTVRT